MARDFVRALPWSLVSDAPLPLQTPRIGIVGAGRSKQGLGPYLAAAFEAAGCRVTAVAGRDAAGAQRGADGLTSQLGHDVAATASAAELARSIDALVIASPADKHAEALDAALAAGVPCLCEKPLVAWQQAEAGRARVRTFAQRGLLLAENCQWPFVLPALFELHPRLAGAPVTRVVMGLSPVGTGLAMVEDSLSHVLSVVQELVPGAGAAEVRGVRQADPRPGAEKNVVAFELAAATGEIPAHEITVELHLQRCPEPPRPAWIEVNGCRIDRRIGEGYTISFATPDGRHVKTADPLHLLVYRFVDLLRSPQSEPIAALAASIDARLRLYALVLGGLVGAR